MVRGAYQTKQKSCVERALRELGERTATADELLAALRADEVEIGKTTVYRGLEQLIAAGRAKRVYAPDGCMRYQYVADAEACRNHLHCQCTACGRLYHVDCTLLDTLGGHLLEKHGFQLDPAQTVLVGLCADCAKEGDGSWRC